jgi:hypothetical protein
MKKGSLRRFVAVSIFGVVCTALNTGCTFLDNVYFGFTAGLGGIPATIVGNFVADLLFAADDDAEVQ